MAKAPNGTLPYLNWDSFKRPEDDAELEAKLEGMRDAYSHALHDILEKVCDMAGEESVAQFVAQDFAMFAVFLVSSKMVELAGVPYERRELLSAFNYLLKRQEREVPEQIIRLAETVAKGELELEQRETPHDQT